MIGVIALGSTMPMAYTAAELKLVNTLALQAATAIENARLFERTVQAAQERERLLALHQAAELARAKLESELTLAARIQADLFPAALPTLDGYELAARNRPGAALRRRLLRRAADLVGRDSEPRCSLCVADVSGKGLPAALVMSNMQATLRALLGRIAALPMLAGHASDLLYAATSPEKYVTAALAELEPVDGRPALRRRRASRQRHRARQRRHRRCSTPPARRSACCRRACPTTRPRTCSSRATRSCSTRTA